MAALFLYVSELVFPSTKALSTSCSKPMPRALHPVHHFAAVLRWNRNSPVGRVFANVYPPVSCGSCQNIKEPHKPAYLPHREVSLDKRVAARIRLTLLIFFFIHVSRLKERAVSHK